MKTNVFKKFFGAIGNGVKSVVETVVGAVYVVATAPMMIAQYFRNAGRFVFMKVTSFFKKPVEA